MTEPIIIAIINACAVLFASIVSGCAIVYAARAVLKKKTLRRKLISAYQDILFLYEVEAIHTAMEIGRGEKDNKVRVRNLVRDETKLGLSGKSKSEIKRDLSALSMIDS